MLSSATTMIGLVVIALLVAGAIVGLRARRDAMRSLTPTSTCPKCGYQREGLPTERCPECGLLYAQAEEEFGGRTKNPFALLLLYAVVGMVLLFAGWGVVMLMR